MKRIFLIIIIFAGITSAAFAKPNPQEVNKYWLVPSVAEKNTKLSAYRIARVITLAKSENKNLYIRLLVIDNGLSTDYSPRYQIFLSYFHTSEENSSYSLFNLGFMQKLYSTSRLRAGVYKITVLPYDPSNPNMSKKTMIVDTLPVFLADKNLRKDPLNDYYLKSSVKIKGVLLFRGWDSNLNKFYKLR